MGRREASAAAAAAAAADCRSDLDALRADVLSMRDGLDERLRTARRALDGLATERAGIAKEREMLRASLADKARVEAELRSRLSSVEEGAKGKSSSTASCARCESAAAAAAAAEEKLRDADDELCRLRSRVGEAELAAARASAAAAVSASGADSLGDRATQMSLRGKEAELAAAREELEAQARAHRAQMTELQESCHAKLRELRRVHDAQLAAAKADAPPPPPPIPAPPIDAADIVKLRKAHEEEVAGLEAELGRLRGALEEAAARERSSVESAIRLAEKEKRKQADAAAAERRAHADELAAERRRAAEAEAAAEEARRLAAAAAEGREAASHAGGAALDMEALDLMEGQVVKLSNILRERERELASLRGTVEAQCAERHQLIAALKAYHDAGGVAPALNGSNGSRGVADRSQSPKSPRKEASQSQVTSPSKAAAALASAGASLVSPRKIGRKVRPVSISRAFK